MRTSCTRRPRRPTALPMTEVQPDLPRNVRLWASRPWRALSGLLWFRAGAKICFCLASHNITQALPEFWKALSPVRSLGGVFLLTRRNLWSRILAHGIATSFAVVAVYFGE